MKYLNSLFAVAAGLLIAGCATNNQPVLPKGAQMVGGGLNIQWRSPESGTAILVEQRTHTYVKTARVIPNTYPGFRFDVNNPDDKQLVGALFPNINPASLQFVLYYVPDSKLATAKEKP